VKAVRRPRLAAFDVFHAHTGTYEVEDSTLTILPVLAKSPNSMDGRPVTYAWTLERDRLTITRRSVAEQEVRITRLIRVE
jgi:hypothetical protein